jgi:putative two-component system response regulator
MNRTLEDKVNERTAELHETRLEIIRRLSMAAEFRDEDTGQHVERIAHYSFLVAQAAGLSKDQCDLLFNTAPCTTSARSAFPTRFCAKRASWTSEEWEVMKTHTYIGAKIIGEHQSDLLTAARIIALTHHERWDGHGYPNGLKGEEIPIFGRIVMMGDVFDALVSKRPYKEAWPIDQALAWIRQEEGRHFDPNLVPLFFDVFNDVLAVRERYT